MQSEVSTCMERADFHVSIINKALHTLGADPLAANADFIKSEIYSDWFVAGFFARKRGAARIYLEITHHAISVFIEEVPEILDIGYDYIVSNPKEVEEIMIDVFSGHLLIERWGRKKSVIYVFNSRGKQIHRLSMSFGLFSFLSFLEEKKRQLYLPLYTPLIE